MGALGDWYAALSPRERKLLLFGAAAVAAFFLYLMLRGGPAATDDNAERVELGAAAQSAPPPVAPAPPPPVVVPPAAVASPPPLGSAPIAAMPGALQLRGVLGAGVIVSEGEGPQRVVRIGRQAAPGLTLKEVGLRHAIFTGPSGDMRLDLATSGTPMLPGATPQ